MKKKKKHKFENHFFLLQDRRDIVENDEWVYVTKQVISIDMFLSFDPISTKSKLKFIRIEIRTTYF
jgi:hypothetical protein